MKSYFSPSFARAGSRCTVVLHGSSSAPTEHHLTSMARAATLAAEALRFNPDVRRVTVWANAPQWERVITVEP